MRRDRPKRPKELLNGAGQFLLFRADLLDLLTESAELGLPKRLIGPARGGHVGPTRARCYIAQPSRCGDYVEPRGPNGLSATPLSSNGFQSPSPAEKSTRRSSTTNFLSDSSAAGRTEKL